MEILKVKEKTIADEVWDESRQCYEEDDSMKFIEHLLWFNWGPSIRTTFIRVNDGTKEWGDRYYQEIFIWNCPTFR